MELSNRWVFGFWFAIVISIGLFAYDAHAECPPGNPIIGGNDPANPIIVTIPCPLIGWTPSTGTVHHYHLRVDQEIYISTPDSNSDCVEVCLPVKNQTLGIDVFAIPVTGTTPSPLSDTTYIRWQDPAPATPTPKTPTPKSPTPATPSPLVCIVPTTVQVTPLPGGQCP